LFETLDEETLEDLAGHFREVSVPQGHRIFRLGQPADSLYILREGAVVIVHDAVGRPVQLLARLTPGDFFGESGLLDGLPRSATARATEPSRLLVIGRAPLLAFLSRHPLLKIQLRRAAIERHGANVDAAAADRTLRKDVRISVDREVILRVEGGERIRCRLDNLSLGGAAVEGVPDDWRLHKKVRFHLGLPGKADSLLELAGVITWRKGRKVGISFRDPTPELRIGITRALQELLGSRRETPG
jgi:CRP-like cAMP-binding protein